MRVLQVIGSLGIGGSQAFMMSIYRKIDKSKIQFDFIIDHSDGDYYINEIESLGGKVYCFSTFKGYNYFSIIKEWTEFFKTHPEYKVLHCHMRSYASLFIPIAKKFGVKVIIHSHNDSNGKGFKSLIKGLLQLPLRFQGDYYMACSQKAGKWLFGEKICTSKKFSVIKNTIDSEQFIYNEKNRSIIRKQYGIEDEFVLGFIARVTEQKNPVFVIEVMKELLYLDKNAILLFVGDGELLEIVKERAAELKISDNIIFTGAQTNVSELLTAMDYYILPSRWEGFGISLIEAQASGINCICSDAITSEAILIEESVKQLDVNLGAKKWAEEIHNTKLNDRRKSKNMVDKIKLKGYDISNNTQFFLDFYSKITKEEID